MAGLIGALRVTLSADTAQFSSGMSKARADAYATGVSIGRSLATIKTAIGGVLAGFSIAQLVQLGQKSLDYASSLGEVAQQLGVTTTELQEYRYAATQVGVSQEQMDKGLAALTLSMGKARAGSKAQVAAFKELSDLIGKDILTNARSAGDAIPLISDAMAKISDPTKRATLEVALFKKAGQGMDTLLAPGSAAINALRDAAHELGIVLSEDQIQKADDTADKLAAVKMVLEANIAGAVSNNVGAIMSLVDALASIVVWAGKGAAALKYFYIQAAVNSAQERANLADNTANGWFTTAAGKKKAMQDSLAAKLEIAELRGQQVEAAKAASGIVNTAATKVQRAGSTGAAAGAVAGGGSKNKGPKDNSARKLYDAERDELRAQMDVIDAQRELAIDIKARSELSAKRLELERQGERLEIQHGLSTGDLTKAQAAKLLATSDQVFELRKQKIDLDLESDLRREQLDIIRDNADAAMDVAQAEAALARTAAERREVERRILDLKYKELRRVQQAIIDDPNSTDDQRNAAGRRLNDINRLERADRERSRRDTMGPLEEFIDKIPKSAAEINEAFERIKVNGLESLNDGIVDAITGAKSLEEVFSNVADQIIADLLRIAVQRMVIAPIADALFGGNGGLGRLFGLGGGTKQGGIFGNGADMSAFKNLPGRAAGGRVSAGRLYQINERGDELFMPHVDGSVIDHTSASRMMAGGGASQSRLLVVPSPYFDVVVDDRARSVAVPIGATAAQAGSRGAQMALARADERRLA